MAQAKVSLSWEPHQKNICGGLCSLQQRGEFVDLTLAADGHLVKVHQMVLALVSPYIKDLISSTPCSHPVIFLNNISHTTLCEILEYIYTGEVLVPQDNLDKLIAAGEALHISGLKDMHTQRHSQDKKTPGGPEMTLLVDKFQQYKEEREHTQRHSVQDQKNPDGPQLTLLVDKFHQYKEESKVMEPDAIPPMGQTYEDDSDASTHLVMDITDDSMDNCNITQKEVPADHDNVRSITANFANLQYTVSNQGGLQIIHNRFVYHLKYVQKNRNKLWRCVDYSAHKCPAKVVTNDSNEVIERSHSHTHPFHDEKILRKLQLGIIYSAFYEAEYLAQAKKKERSLPNIPLPPP